MSEIIQIPNNLNLQLSTLLFGQNPDYQSGKFTLEDLKNFLDEYFSNSGSGNGIYISDIPPENPYLGMPWIEPSSGQLWIYAYIDSQYRWASSPSAVTIGNNSSVSTLTFSFDFDYYIKSYSFFFQNVTLSPSGSNYSFTGNLRTGVLSGSSSSERNIASITFTNFQQGRNYSQTRLIDKIISPKYNNIDSDLSDAIGLRCVPVGSNFGGTSNSNNQVIYSLVRREDS